MKMTKETERMIGLYNNMLVGIQPDENMAKVVCATADLIQFLLSNPTPLSIPFDISNLDNYSNP